VSHNLKPRPADKPVKILEWAYGPDRTTFRLVRTAHGTIVLERKMQDALGDARWIHVCNPTDASDPSEVVVEGLVAEIVRLRAEVEVAKVNASPRAQGWDGTWPGPGPLP
jgi:hypothetical protein